LLTHHFGTSLQDLYLIVYKYMVCDSSVSACLQELVKFNLSDIGEGIREVHIKEW